MIDYTKFVVHCKVSKYDVYIGRPSKYGNPYSHKEGTLAKFKVSTIDEAIEKYREWILQPEQEQLLYDAKVELKNKILGCWCHNKCHGHILAELANNEEYNEMSGSQKIDRFTDTFGFLSNFHECNIEHEGILYPSVEHYYQAQKTLDLFKRKRISELKSPYSAKTAGRGLVLRKDWENVKLSVMYEGLKKKFVPGSDLAEMLLATEELPLEEGNTWYDIFWGVDAKTGVGENYLGKLLMKIRKELKDNQK